MKEVDDPDASLASAGSQSLVQHRTTPVLFRCAVPVHTLDRIFLKMGSYDVI
jgi:hypothetical protein